MARLLCVPGRAMLWRKEIVKQGIDFEECFAGEREAARGAREEAASFEIGERGGESIGGIDAELGAEIIEIEVAELHLENELADEALIVREGEGAIDGEAALVERVEVGIEIVEILEVGAADVREGSDAQAEHVG